MNYHGTEYAWCPNCDDTQPTDLVGRIESYTVRGESIEVASIVRVCRRCGQNLFDWVIDAHNLRQVYEAYNRLHPADPIPVGEAPEPEPPIVQDMRRALAQAIRQGGAAPPLSTVDLVRRRARESVS